MVVIITSYFHIFMAPEFLWFCLTVRECDTWLVWFKFHETIIMWVLISDGLGWITHPFRVKMYQCNSSSLTWYQLSWFFKHNPNIPKICNILPTSKPYTHPGKRYICIYLHQNGCDIWLLNRLELKSK